MVCRRLQIRGRRDVSVMKTQEWAGWDLVFWRFIARKITVTNTVTNYGGFSSNVLYMYMSIYTKVIIICSEYGLIWVVMGKYVLMNVDDNDIYWYMVFPDVRHNMVNEVMMINKYQDITHHCMCNWMQYNIHLLDLTLKPPFVGSRKWLS